MSTVADSTVHQLLCLTCFAEKAPEIFITDEGIKMVVVLSPADIYVWEMDPHQDLFALKVPNILGTWSHVGADPKVQVPSRDFKETSLAVKFFLDEVRIPSKIAFM